MAVAKKKYRVLVCGTGDKIFDYIESVLPPQEYEQILRAGSAGEARRKLLETSVDVVIINSPLADEFGTDFALDLADGTCGVLMLVKSDVYADICYQVEDSGVAVLSKPMNSQNFLLAVKLVTAMSARLSRMEKKNQSLQEKMADIRMVNRAKWLLIDHMHMTEPDAHYYIEKQAMDSRLPRREVAENIIRSYGQ